MEMEEFKDSYHHTGYFCYNCIYFMKPNHCAIVTDEGPDVYGKSSSEIAHIWIGKLKLSCSLTMTELYILVGFMHKKRDLGIIKDAHPI